MADLLVGAVSNQRPELFRAVVEQAGVMDMLRFHTDSPSARPGSRTMDRVNRTKHQFKALYAYSPIHNVKAGTKVSRDFDCNRRSRRPGWCRAHFASKYAAALQAGQGGDLPI